MSDLITNFTQNQAGAITTLNNQPVTESVEVKANPNSRGVNDISDIRPTSAQVNLPIRGEKRFIPTQGPATIEVDPLVNGSLVHIERPVKNQDFYTYANTEAKRLQNGVDYMKIRIPHRGVNSSTLLPDPTQDVEFRFLVNPSTLTVNRQTVDTQAFTRGGWQFGVWGEDAFTVQIQGVSAGTYFSLGTTDEFQYYTVSYRNLMQLQQLFENNGYWFEGEEFNEGPLAADYLRRRIRMHEDVQLWVGNFIWFGMFDSFSVSQDATNPFMLNFQLSFFVWKERYRSTSPYWGSIENNVQRGHSYEAVEGDTASTQSNNTLSTYSPSGVDYQSSQVASAMSTSTNQPYSNNPAVTGSAAEDLLQTTSPVVSTQIGTQPLSLLTLPNLPANKFFWSGS